MKPRHISTSNQKLHTAARIAAGLLLIQISGASNAMAWGWTANSNETDTDYDQFRETFEETQQKYRRLAEELENTISEARARFDRLRDERARLETRNSAAQKDLAQLRLQREKREQELHEQENLITAIEKKFEEVSGRVLVYENAVQAEKRLRKTERDLEILKKRFSASVQEKKNLARESMAALDTLQNALEKRKAGETVAKKKLSESQEALKQLEQALRGSQTTTAILSEKLDAAEKNVSEFESKNQTLAHQYSDMRQQLAEVEHKNVTLEQIVATQKKRTDNLDTNLAKMEKAKRTAIAEAKSSLELLESFVSRQEDLMRSLERARNDIGQPQS